VILVAGIVDLVVTALLNGGADAAGLWYLVLVPITVAHMRGARQTTLWTGICVAAVCVVAVVDPFWPFARDLRTETLSVVVSMRIMLLGAVGAFALASAKAANHHIAAIEEREARLQQMVAALRDAEQELTAKNAELDSFVYSVSHDLKAPLVAVQGFAGILADDYGPQLDAEGRHFLGRVQANVQQMERLIRNLLALSRTGRDGRSPELVDLGEVVDGFVAEASETLRARGVTVRRRDLGVLWAVRTEIEQAMRNLLSNAVKYLGDTPAPLIEVGMREAGPMVECWVKDNGIGIDPQYHDTVFEIFQRLQEVEAEGTGVGLAIVRKVVSRGGGRIWVESRKGQGATFRFTWPAHAAAPGAEAVPAVAAS
jgi:signal transduction histidine kinase